MTDPNQTFDPITLHRYATAITTHAETYLLTDQTLNKRLSDTLTSSTAQSLPTITISALQGQFLALQCKLMGAKRVLEIGTLGGYSTTWFAGAGCHVTSIEINPRHRDIAVENTKGLDVEVVLGAALDVLPRLKEERRTFDFVFVDASWGEQWECFDWGVKLLRPGGAVFVDNVVRELIEGGVEGETLVSRVGRDERVEATVVGTINSDKVLGEMYDGFLLARVKDGSEFVLS